MRASADRDMLVRPPHQALDVTLTRLDGVSLVRRIRETSRVPVLRISGRPHRGHR
ncbi:hypothetical protein [Streptomyces coacervatus]|uniref:hypothetical protein n=1 Tax=Streptomyces coacervatus TaxID=647381 RepID=UPI0030B85652